MANSKQIISEAKVYCDGCGAGAAAFNTRKGAYRLHCPSCGRTAFFGSPVLLERAKHKLPLCSHDLVLKTAKISYSGWCSRCRLRVFAYDGI